MREAISAHAGDDAAPMPRRPAACRPLGDRDPAAPAPRAAGWRAGARRLAVRRRRRAGRRRRQARRTRLYDMAWADYTAGSYDLAIEGFTSLRRDRSRAASSPTTRRYYIGESYFQRGRLAPRRSRPSTG